MAGRIRGRGGAGKLPLCGSTRGKIRPDLNERNCQLSSVVILFHQTGSEQGLRVLVDASDVATE